MKFFIIIKFYIIFWVKYYIVGKKLHTGGMKSHSVGMKSNNDIGMKSFKFINN